MRKEDKNKLKFEMGAYVRTSGGDIFRYLGKDTKVNDIVLGEYRSDFFVSTSFNLKDLIKEGDYVNGQKVWKNTKDNTLYISYLFIDEKRIERVYQIETMHFIESIMTKEAYEFYSYKIGNIL